MNLLKEFVIILILLKVGEIIHYLVEDIFNLPATIFSMTLLFLLLYTKLIPLEKIMNISNALLNNMAFFFIPLGVKIVTQLHFFSNSILKLILIIVITTLVTISVSAIATEGTIKFMNYLKKDHL